MQITPDGLLREAADMALELRLKDRALADVEAERDQLRKRLADLEGPDGGQSGEAQDTPHNHSH